MEQIIYRKYVCKPCKREIIKGIVLNSTQEDAHMPPKCDCGAYAEDAAGSQ